MKKKGRHGGSKRAKSAEKYWNTEYSKEKHFALSENPSEDLMKFTRFLQRLNVQKILTPVASALDLGCGNGRNLAYLTENFGMKGIGYDISAEAIALARKRTEGYPIEYNVRSIVGDLSIDDSSQSIVLDMMTSHFLSKEEREKLHSEVYRVLRPGGWYFLKTFLLDEDPHAKRLLEENPGDEEGTYIHPKIGVAEHVFTEEELVEELEKDFSIEKVLTSHGHLRRSAKRRSIVIYARKSF